ncbi:hypothetical protein ABT294_37265 [Nonomuraea sp. NPDC000554]|uniref:hypothetical protein n=1 Tax=Nonomuraea sp. NPDC000554 TaxID=3154259 RepID=UPI00332EACB9
MESNRFAEIQVLQEALGPAVKVVVPKGTGLEQTVKLQPHITDIIRGLNGCPACTSGVPVWIVEEPEISQIVRVDLESMKRL